MGERKPDRAQVWSVVRGVEEDRKRTVYTIEGNWKARYSNWWSTDREDGGRGGEKDSLYPNQIFSVDKKRVDGIISRREKSSAQLNQGIPKQHIARRRLYEEKDSDSFSGEVKAGGSL